jgi:hypothetical protein
VHRGGLTRGVGEAPRPSLRRPSLKTIALRWVPGLPVLLAGGFTIWLLSRFSGVIDTVHLNPDASFAPVLVGDLPTGAKGGLVLVGEASHLTAIGFLWVTRGFPFRDLIWDWGPYVTFLVGLGIGAWACWRVAGPWAAAMTISVGACAEATVLLTVAAEGLRGHTFFAVAVMCAFLVGMVQRPDMPRRRKVAAAGLTIALAGSTVASDPLFLPVGLAPLTGAALLVWLLRRDRAARALAVLTVGVAGGAMIVSQVIWVVMRSIGVRKNYLEAGYSVVDRSQVWPNVRVFLRHVMKLTHAAPLTHPSRAMLSELAMTLVIIAITLYAFSLLFRLRRRPGGPAAGAAGTALLAYTAFWVLSGLGVLAAFALSSFSTGRSDTSRYVIPVFLAFAAVGPLWGRGWDWRRLVVAAGAALFCMGSITGRGKLFYQNYPGLEPFRSSSTDIVAFLEREGLTHGYAGYFSSHPVTMLSGQKIHSYPVIACHAPASDVVCPFFVNIHTGWYVPRPDQRTFFIYGGGSLGPLDPAPPIMFGPPSSTHAFGAFTVSVFDYDIASRFAPPCIDPGILFCPPAGPA